VRCRAIKVLVPDAFDVVDRKSELHMFDFLADQQRELSAMVAGVVANGQSSPSTYAELVAGDPVDVLAEMGRHADLLVVGSKGHGAVTSLFLGSVSSALLHRRVCPTVVIPPNADRHGDCHRIVVGIDGSEGAERALRWATREAQRRKCELAVVHAWHVPVLVASPYAPTMSVPASDCEQAGRETLDQALRLLEPDVDVAIIPRLVEGVADLELRAAGTEADLIVVGGRGRAGLAAALLGSTSRSCVHHAPCPVAVIP
jgi:nucleotide-binding universal stress UspA family protein